jgi:hypothetical protein
LFNIYQLYASPVISPLPNFGVATTRCSNFGHCPLLLLSHPLPSAISSYTRTEHKKLA